MHNVIQGVYHLSALIINFPGSSHAKKIMSGMSISPINGPIPITGLTNVGLMELGSDSENDPISVAEGKKRQRLQHQDLVVSNVFDSGISSKQHVEIYVLI
ncbi:hypothetical protein GQ457_07G004670 [Hibiscus cannabinus]